MASILACCLLFCLICCLNFHSCSCSDSFGFKGSLKRRSVSSGMLGSNTSGGCCCGWCLFTVSFDIWTLLMRRAARLSLAFCTYGALSCELAFLQSLAICFTLVDQSGYSSLRLGKLIFVYRTGATVASSPSVSSFSHLSVLLWAFDMASVSPSGIDPGGAGPGPWAVGGHGPTASLGI